MKSWSIFWFHLTIIFAGLLIILIPSLLLAKTITVPTDFSTIQEAIDDAVSGDLIQVKPRAENYEENIILKEGITLEGVETARTILDGRGSGVVITASNNTTIRKLTITGGITGIAVTGISNISISNNIIVDNTTGIECPNSNVTINNNTIDNNVDGIFCTNAQTVSITNNLIINNGTGMNLINITTLTAGNNGFNANGGNGDEGTDPVKKGDPLFVNPTQNDYHLKNDSPYRGIDPVDPEDDLGAYGGSGADLTPFRIIGLTSSPPGIDTVDISWNTNLAYNIKGYRVYFNKNKGIHQNPLATDTTICVSNQCMFTITGLDNTVTPSEAPTLNQPATGDQKLFLSWVPPANQENISTYKVFWGTASGNYNDPGSPRDVGNITAYTLPDLINNIPYFIAVKAVAQPRFFISVTAIDNAVPPNESSFFEDKEIFLDSKVESLFSNEVLEFPEVVVGFPDLPDQGGCFIATAAYGSPLEPHVQILKEFRDSYLLPTALGRRFVAIYYHYGPPLANFIQEHDFVKSLVRLLLLPVIGLSFFFLKTTIVQKVGVFLALSLLVIIIMRVRDRSLGASNS